MKVTRSQSLFTHSRSSKPCLAVSFCHQARSPPPDDIVVSTSILPNPSLLPTNSKNYTLSLSKGHPLESCLYLLQLDDIARPTWTQTTRLAGSTIALPLYLDLTTATCHPTGRLAPGGCRKMKVAIQRGKWIGSAMMTEEASTLPHLSKGRHRLLAMIRMAGTK